MSQNYFVCPRCGAVHDVDPKPSSQWYQAQSRVDVACDAPTTGSTAHSANGRALTLHEFAAALLDPPPNHTEAIHERVARECWKQHGLNFLVCDQPACVLLRRLAGLLRWGITLNGVVPQPPFVRASASGEHEE